MKKEFKGRRFQVNKEKGIVTCILTDKYEQEIYTFVGIAKCDPQDQFDEEIGKLIAFKKAKIKRNKIHIKACQLIKEEMLQNLDTLNQEIERREKAIQDIKKDIEKIY